MTIINRGPDTWLVIISAGKRPDGTRHRPCLTVHGAYKDAQKAERRLLVEHDGKRPARSTMIVSEWVDCWLSTVKKHRAPNTARYYRSLLDQQILRHLGHIRLDKLEPRDIARFMLALAGQRNARTGNVISGHTQLKYYRAISYILQEAVYAGLLAQNPAKAVKAPRMTKHRAAYLEADDVTALWTALQREPLQWRVVIATALLLGVSRGELIGLQWKDIDTQRMEVHIRRAAYRTPGNPQTCKVPKTDYRERIIPLPQPLHDLLTHWREKQMGTNEDYLCATRPGGWMNIDAPNAWLRQFLTRHNLPPIGLHGLRHTAASLLLDAGLPLRAVAEHLGHGQTSTTANIYAHALAGSKARAGSILGNAVTNPATPVATDMRNGNKLA